MLSERERVQSYVFACYLRAKRIEGGQLWHGASIRPSGLLIQCFRWAFSALSDTISG